MQTLAAVQGEPSGSNVHVGEQQSPASLLPSSHCSPTSRTPLAQTLIVWPVIVNRFEPTPPMGSPGPVTWTKLVPQGLPVMVWGVSPSPMKPAGGAVSHVRKVEPTGPLSASENAVGRSEIGIAPTVTVSTTAPRAFVVSDFTP